jgi:hypothetical protein
MSEAMLVSVLLVEFEVLSVVVVLLDTVELVDTVSAVEFDVEFVVAHFPSDPQVGLSDGPVESNEWSVRSLPIILPATAML